MKYYFARSKVGKRYIAVAKDEKDLKTVLEKAKIKPKCFYELKEDTFENSGFLISDIS